MGKIHLIRHGTTEANLTKKFYGSTDLPLSNKGINIISEYAVAGIYPDAKGATLYTSGLLRAEQTFFLIYGCKDHIILPELREYHFGEFEMKTHEQLKENPDYQAWINDKNGLTSCPEGESTTDFRMRVNAGFAKVLENHNKEENSSSKSIIVCHGGVISLIMGICFPDVKQNIFHWQPDPGRGYTLNLVDGEAVLYEKI
ncbi:MAG: histidine phosphatase family protein [Eubacteriales bacterium]|nr:histidine phosphatase family protein [Eubacteriales bacterium]MDD3199395.1 histidine phosphatase family protein [Eubacteriales bacterium]MDD4629937.1 histidine phosphatase family protein [Eubacteriales bacterium]